MYYYTAYELGIHSQLPLPELVAVENVAEDVAIHLRKIDSCEKMAARNSTYFLGETIGVGLFLVRGGNEIILDLTPGADESLMRAILLGPLTAVLLRQRGLAVLHASGIVIDGRAVAFLGQSGGGKSTLAEAFYIRGYRVVTDDVMAVCVDGNCPQVIPGYPSVKLFPAIAAFLECETRAQHEVHPQTGKHAHNVALGFPQVPLPLGRIYTLAVGEFDSIEPLQPREAFLELLRNFRAVSLLRDSDSLNAHLRQCTRLAVEVPVFRLRRRAALSALSDVVRLIEKDLTENV